MEAIFHFIFELFKITILSSLYSSIILLFIIYVSKRKYENQFEKISKNKLKIWMINGFIISILLFFYMFSYWGNHGLGDSARIPIGYSKEVIQVNGITALIEPKNYEYGALEIEKFSKSNGFLVGLTKSSPVDMPKPYFIWNLKDDKITFLDTLIEYNSLFKKNKLPKISSFKTFQENYSNYWHGLRFWLLP